MNREAEQAAARSRREERIKRLYAEIKASRPDEFAKCIQYAEGIVLNHHVALAKLTDAERSRLAADIEVSMVMLFAETGR